jgi:hypothetical protein
VVRKATEFTQFKLRIQQGLRREIEKAAKKNNRSANNEAVYRLEKSFSAEKETDAYRLMFENFMSQLDARYVIKEVQ